MKQPKIQMWEHVIWTGYPLLLLGMFFLPVLSLQGCFSCILWTGFKLAAGLLQRKNVPSQFIAVVCQGMIVVLFMLVILQIRNIFRCRKGKYQCKETLAVRGGLVMIYLILSVICVWRVKYMQNTYTIDLQTCHSGKWCSIAPASGGIFLLLYVCSLFAYRRVRKRSENSE